MTKEEIAELIPPIPLAEVRKNMVRAKLFADQYVSRVNPIYPKNYDNATSEAVYDHLVKVSEEKERFLATQENG